MPTNVLGCIGDPELLEKYRDKLEMLIYRTQGPGLHLERINKEADTYTIRISGQPRLILTSYQNHWVVLDEDLGHGYDDKFERKETAVTSKAIYLDKNADLLKQQMDDLKALAEAPGPASTVEPQLYIRYGKKIILLSEEQLQLLEGQWPIAVEGAPGSGKTCSGVAIIEKKLQEYARMIEHGTSPADLEPIFYTACSQKLVDSIRVLFQQNSITKDFLDNLLQVKTVSQLLSPHALGKENIPYEKSKNTFHDWYVKTAFFKRSKKEFGQDFFIENDVFQEFRIISAGIENYKKLGISECLFYDHKEKLIDAYNVYQVHLDSQGKIDFSMVKIDSTLFADQQCGLIVADESADLSYAQIEMLLAFAKRKNVFLNNEDQSLEDNISNVPLFSKLVVNLIHLPITYRCPELVLKLVELYKKRKFYLNGGALSKDGLRSMNVHPDAKKGAAILLDEAAPEINDLVKASDSADLAIIAHEKYVADAKKLFGVNATVLTVQEAKGLEFEVVVCYKLLDIPIYREADKALKGAQFKEDYPNLPKEGALKLRCAKDINALIVTFTRTLGSLYFIQANNDGVLDNILAPITEVLTPKKEEPNLIQLDYSEEKWEELAGKFLQEGFEQKSADVFTNRLSRTHVEFLAFKEKMGSSAPYKIPVKKPEEIASVKKPRKAKEVMLVMKKPAAPKEQTKEEIYAAGLLKSFSAENISGMLGCKNPLKYLNAMVGGKDLYAHILDLDDVQYALFSSIALSKSFDFRKILDKIINRLEDALEWKVVPFEREFPFFYRAFLLDVNFINNRPRIKKLCEHFLADEKNMTSSEYRYFFTIFCFFNFDRKLPHIKKLSKDKRYSESVTPSLFFRILDDLAGRELGGFSVAYSLFGIDAFPILENILRCNKEITKNMPLHVFFGDKIGNSALSLLSIPAHVSVLNRFLKDSPGLYESIPIEAWVFFCNMNIGTQECPVSNLLKTEMGIDIVNKIIDKSPQLLGRDLASIMNLVLAESSGDLFAKIPSSIGWADNFPLKFMNEFIDALKALSDGKGQLIFNELISLNASFRSFCMGPTAKLSILQFMVNVPGFRAPVLMFTDESELPKQYPKSQSLKWSKSGAQKKPK